MTLRLAVAGNLPRPLTATSPCNQRASAGAGATRISPLAGYRVTVTPMSTPMSAARPVATFLSSPERPDRPGIVQLHVFEPLADAGRRASKVLRGTFGRTYVVNGGYEATATGAISSGSAGLVTFGTPLIATTNPDLQRYRTGAALDAPVQSTTTTGPGNDQGFIDGPAPTDAPTQGVAMGTACQEMTLRSALSDPLIRTVMAADKVDPGELESMLRGIAEQIASHGPPHTAVEEPRISDAYRRRILS